MKYLILMTLFVVGCGLFESKQVEHARDVANFRGKFKKFFKRKRNKSSSSSRITKPLVVQPSKTVVQILKDRRDLVSKWVAECPKGSEYQGQISDKHGHCDQGDVISWAGYTCLASQLAGDTLNRDKRCRDVSLAQATNGRWWRGQSRIETQTANSFSRDMSLGVISYFISQGLFSSNQTANIKAREQAEAWMEYIEREGNGKDMCDDDKWPDNRCTLLKGSGSTVYKVMEKMGVIKDKHKNYKFVKKFKKDRKFWIWHAETKVTEVGYQLHLKSQEIFFRYIANMVTGKQYKKFTKTIYNKDPLNPWYEFLYLGPQASWVDRILDVCPAQAPQQENWVVHHAGNGDWAWQRSSSERAWEIANGHDCVFLLNLAIAQLEGKINLPFSSQQNSNKCADKKNYLGEYEFKNICKARPHFKINARKCEKKNGVFHTVNNTKWCLQDKGSYFKAREVKSDCPSGHTADGVYKTLPVCKKNKNNKIRLYKCVKGQGNHVEPQWTQNHEFCFVNKTTYFQKLKISTKKCPITNPKFENEFVWGAWPVCKGHTKIKREDCKEENYMQPKENYCLVQKSGWFSKRKYKSGCPFGKTSTGLTLFEKPVCKPIPHFKIKDSKCSKKSGTKWNGYCVWDKGSYYKARQLK